MVFPRSRKRAPAPAPSTRQLTRKTGRIHKLWRKATSSTRNKAVLISILAIVGSIAGLFVTSRGSIAPSFSIFRSAMEKIPGGLGKKIIGYVQQLVDLFLKVIGVGLKVGTVVAFKNDEDILVEKDEYALTDGSKNNKISVSNVFVGDALAKLRFVVCEAKNGCDTVLLASYDTTAADGTERAKPSHEELSRWCKKNKNGIKYSNVVVDIAATEAKRNDPFPFPRVLLTKCDKDEQISKKD